MNERIRELTVKALSSCNPAKMTSLSSSVDNGDGVDIPLEFSEKFAELIVRECIDLFNYDPTGAMSSMAESIHNDIAVKRIQEHFGVK